jgi:hypothetical protein
VEGWRWRLGRDGVLRGNTPRIVWSGVYVVQLKVIIKHIWFRGYCLRSSMSLNHVRFTCSWPMTKSGRLTIMTNDISCL